MASSEILKNSSSDDNNVAATDLRYKLVEFANESTKGIPLFEYDKLEDMKNRIRLLRLYAGPPENPHVECELFQGEFSPDGRLIEPPSIKANNEESMLNGHMQSDPGIAKKATSGELHPPRVIKYEALSWRWASEPSHQILIRKGITLTRKPAHQQLVWALKYLRQVKEDRILWIDALCINQSNTVERNHQVEMMARIYSVADGVCIWLGIDDKESRLAIKFIKDEVMKLQQFDELCEKEENSEKWQSLLTLMQRSWFSRRWVVQEIALARKAKIYCGPDEIDWDQFAIAVELFVEVETATHRLSEVMKKDRKYYHVPGWFEYVSELGASLLVQATGTIFRDEKRIKKDTKKEANSTIHQVNGQESKTKPSQTNDSETEALERRPLLSLEHLVSTLSAFDVSEPRDAIYALLAIANDTSPLASLEEQNGSQVAVYQTQNVLETFTVRKRYIVDYDKPYEDICKDFITFCIDRSCKDNIATTRALDILCRPWTPEMAIGKSIATGKEERASIPLPSWIPQLSGASFGMIATPGIRSQKMDRKNADTLVGYPLTGQRNYNAAQTWGIDKSTLKWRKRLSDNLLGGNVPDLSKQLQDSNKPDKRSIVSRQRKGLDPSIEPHYSMYVKGFILDVVERTTEASQNGAIPKEWIELADWKNPLDANTDVPEEFWRTLVADRGKDGRNPPVYYAKACKESVSKGGLLTGAVNTTSLIHNERNSIVAQFCRRVQAVIWNRSLIQTESKRLGLVAKGVRKGDLVCILYGCSVPVILRKSEKPKTANQIKEERRYDLQELVLSAVEASKRQQKRLQERKKKYDKRNEAEKTDIKKHTEEVIRKLEDKRDEQLKKEMNGWLEGQRRKGYNWAMSQKNKTTDDELLETRRKGFKRQEKEHREMVNQWINDRKNEAKGGEMNEVKILSSDKNLPEDPKDRSIEREKTDIAGVKAKSKNNDLPRDGDGPRDRESEGLERKNSGTEAKAGSKNKGLLRNDDPLRDTKGKDPEKKEEESKSGKVAFDDIGNSISKLIEMASNEKNTLEAIEQFMRKFTELREMMDEAAELTGESEDEKWHYTFLGECYIHGMMDGEAIRELTERPRELRDQLFELR